MAARFSTLSSSSWQQIGVPSLIAFQQDWSHQSFISCSINSLMNSRSYWSIILLEDKIGLEANDLVTCILKEALIA